MAFIKYNANPKNNETIDCVIRGISKVMDISWDAVYIMLVAKGFQEKNIFTINDIWIDVLLENGYEMHYIPNTCPDCITVRRFAAHHPNGNYLLGTGSHVIAVCNGDYFDTWNSGSELPLYYFYRREKT